MGDGNTHERLDRDTVKNLLKVIASQAGIKKPVHLD